MKRNRIYRVDALKGLKRMKSESVDMLITSPPYFQLRDYKVEGQIGLEDSVEEYLSKLFDIFSEAQRVLKKEGTCWVNLGDRYGDRRHLGRHKSMLGIPEQFMLGMMSRGWILRNKIIWHKPNPVPSSVKDRLTNSWEYLFLFVKSRYYYFDLDAIRTPHKTQTRRQRPESPRETDRSRKIREFMGQSGMLVASTASLYCSGSSKWYHAMGKNPGDCWSIPSQPFKGMHFATFPERLIEPPIATTPQSICTQCDKPKKRITETKHTKKVDNCSNNSKKAKRSDSHIHQPTQRRLAYHYTLGWSSCSCKAPFQPALILDPFLGSGTTALVARRLDRDFIGFELNPEYIELARKRLKECATKS